MENQRLNRRLAIRANCLECCGDSFKLVRECQSPNCALYPFRKGITPIVETVTKTKAIRLRCLECVGHSEKDVRECTLKTCKLYRYRMGSESKG